MNKFVCCLFTIYCCLPAALTETASRQMPSGEAGECKPLPLACKTVIEKIIKSKTFIDDNYDNQEFLSELFVQQLDMLVLMTLVIDDIDDIVVGGTPPVCIGNTTFIRHPDDGRLIKASGGQVLIPALLRDMVFGWTSLNAVLDFSVVESTATFCEATVFDIVEEKIRRFSGEQIGHCQSFIKVSEATTTSNSKAHIVTVGTGIIEKQL